MKMIYRRLPCFFSAYMACLALFACSGPSPTPLASQSPPATTTTNAATSTIARTPTTAPQAADSEMKYDTGTATDFYGLYGMFAGELVKFSVPSMTISSVKIYGRTTGETAGKTFTVES